MREDSAEYEDKVKKVGKFKKIGKKKAHAKVSDQYNSMFSPLWNIPFTHVTPPELNIQLGCVAKHSTMVKEVHELDKNIGLKLVKAPVQATVLQYVKENCTHCTEKQKVRLSNISRACHERSKYASVLIHINFYAIYLASISYRICFLY